MKKQNIPSCCEKKSNNLEKGLLSGIVYGTIPHIGCIAFILFSVLGLTIASSIFKPLFAKAYFFYAMILLSFIFASMSAFFYLRKQGGIKTANNHKSYLFILFGTTLGIAAIMYFFVFPMVAGLTATTGHAVEMNNSHMITLKVAIPCEGHAPLITDELKKINGVENIEFNSPNLFKVSYDYSKTTENEILSREIFKEYKATVI